MTGSRREWGTGLAVVDRIEYGDERERAAHVPKTVIRPLAARGADGTR
jgi:hypothetical protein